jgi:hypothetical protein
LWCIVCKVSKAIMTLSEINISGKKALCTQEMI